MSSFKQKQQQQKNISIIHMSGKFRIGLSIETVETVTHADSLVNSEYKSNGSIDIESSLEMTKESQNLHKSTFVFSSVTLVVSL